MKLELELMEIVLLSSIVLGTGAPKNTCLESFTKSRLNLTFVQQK